MVVSAGRSSRVGLVLVAAALLLLPSTGPAHAAPPPSSAPKPGDLPFYTYDSYTLSDGTTVKVNVSNGNLVVAHREYSTTAGGVDLNIDHVYNSAQVTYAFTSDGCCDAGGWQLTHIPALTLRSDGSADLRGPSGYSVTFPSAGVNAWKSPLQLMNATLRYDAGQPASRRYAVEFADTGDTWWFDTSGKFTEYAYATGASVRRASWSANLVDAGGPLITFTQYDSTDCEGFFYRMSARGEAPQDRSFSYSWDGCPLRAYSQAGKTQHYGYDANRLLNRLTDRNGQVIQLSIDSSRRLRYIVWGPSAGDARTTYQYEARRTIITDPNGTTRTIYLDDIAPGPVSLATATFDPATSEVEMSWNPAVDPPLPDGSPGAGVLMYTYRYRRDGGVWSGWADTQVPEFDLTGGHHGEIVDLEVRAMDDVGNVGPLVSQSDVALPADWTPGSYGAESGQDVSHIGFSEHPEPDEPDDDPTGSSMDDAPLTDSWVYRAADYTEDNCDFPSPCGDYDQKAAARYARFWFDRRNRDYAFFDNDCTNFVSQALKAGGMRFIRTGGFNDPTPRVDDYREHYKKGYGSWWSAFVPSGGSGYVNWRWTRSFTLSQSSYDRLLEFGVGRTLGGAERVRRGDVVYYRLDPDNEDFTHAAIVSRVTKKGIYVAQHTKNYENLFADVVKRLNSNPDYDGWSYRFVRPEHRAYDLDQ